MNQFNKKPKNKSFKKKSFKDKPKKLKKSFGKSKKTTDDSDGKHETTSKNEIEDKDLKQGLSEIISDFKRSNQKTTSGHKKVQKTAKVETKKNNNFSDNQKSTQSFNSFTEETNDGRSKRRRKQLVRTEGKWYELRQWPEVTNGSVDDKNQHKYSLQKIQELRREAEQLLRQDIEVYQELQDNNKGKAEDFQWIHTVLRSGTLADKLSAHTVLIQDSPVHNLKSLETIISMVNTKGKRECIMALDNLRDLFIGDLLIPDKKLRQFSDLLNFFDDKNKDKKGRHRQLVMCLFEEQLKCSYRLFLESVVKVSHDSVDTTKHKALITFFDLLVNNGEQEQYLLSNLINKLGDPLPKLAAQSTHLLNQLINQYHPQMKEVVAEEVERLLYRPNISPKAQYYSLCFLSEIIFASDDRPLANRLIKLYFGFFKACVKKGDINNKMMSVLLTGVTRAFPYSKLETPILEEHLQTFYKIIHFVNENTSIQALLLIFNIIDVNETGLLTDRFYSVLYRHMQDIHLDNCSRKAMFLNLIFRAMKRDPIHRRVKAFIKRLLQMSLTQSSSLVTSVLILISEVIKSKPGLMLSKEVRQVLKPTDDEEDEEERYEDVPMSDDEVAIESTNKEPVKAAKPSSVSWVHNKNINTNRTKAQSYDPTARNPLFAAAETEELWELELMKHNFHPSAQLFTEKILNNESIDYSGDPITDFSLKHFLDRFVFRNPKKVEKKSRTSIGSKVFGRSAPPTDGQGFGVPINTKAYLSQPESKIRIDEKFIYSYLKQRVLTKSDGYDSDVESVTSLEFESLLDRLEPMSKKDRNIDFDKDFYKQTKGKNKEKSDEGSDDEISDEDDQQLDGSADGDDDMDFDEDDPEFAEAFGDIDSELEEAFDGNSDDIFPKKRKQGFDRMTNDLFASADEFAQLLEANQSDSDIGSGAEGDEQNMDFKTELKNRRKLGRNKQKKRKIFNKQDLDL